MLLLIKSKRTQYTFEKPSFCLNEHKIQSMCRAIISTIQYNFPLGPTICGRQRCLDWLIAGCDIIIAGCHFNVARYDVIAATVAQLL